MIIPDFGVDFVVFLPGFSVVESAQSCRQESTARRDYRKKSQRESEDEFHADLLVIITFLEG
jgi:hypothetical protein